MKESNNFSNTSQIIECGEYDCPYILDDGHCAFVKDMRPVDCLLKYEQSYFSKEKIKRKQEEFWG